MYQLLREVSRFSFRIENIHCHTFKLRFYKTVLYWQYIEVNDNVPSEGILSLISVNYASVLLNAVFKPRIPFGLTVILLNLLTVAICLVCIFQSILIQFFCHCFLKLQVTRFPLTTRLKCLFLLSALNPFDCSYYCS